MCIHSAPWVYTNKEFIRIDKDSSQTPGIDSATIERKVSAEHS